MLKTTIYVDKLLIKRLLCLCTAFGFLEYNHYI